jgi:hypothetical protein
MTSRSRVALPRFVAGVCLLLAAACDDMTSPGGVASPADPASLSRAPETQQERFRPGEEQSAALAREVPGFGGFYLDESGNLHAYLLDRKNEGLARAALARVLAETRRDLGPRERRRFSAQPEIFIHQGQYEFVQLADWRNRLTDAVLRVPGVVYNGLDEHTNRLAVGVDQSRTATVTVLVERKLAELGIPRSAVNIEESEPILIEECTTLDDPNCSSPSEDPCTVDPSTCEDPGTIYPEDPSYSYESPPSQTLGSKFQRLMGGIRIRNYARGGVCTLGFVTLYKGTASFATNSHCTPSRGYPDNSLFYQPTWDYFQVGQEWVDNGTMVFGRYNTDLSIARMQNISGYLGYIARTRNDAYGAYARADTIVNPSAPMMQIIAEVQPRKDYYFEKIGATTGWTYGIARRVCYDTSTMKCVSWVEAGADEGDSGAPAFRWYGSTIGLAGLVYAKTNGGFWMTPMSQIRKDLGATGTLSSDLRTY